MWDSLQSCHVPKRQQAHSVSEYVVIRWDPRPHNSHTIVLTGSKQGPGKDAGAFPEPRMSPFPLSKRFVKMRTEHLFSS